MSQAQIEAEWVRQIRSGDAKAFEGLFRLYCQTLIHFARRYVQDVSLAESLVQDVFLAVWANKSQLDPTQNIKTYLYTAVKHQALKHLRHLAVERRSTQDVTEELPRLKTPEDERQDNELAAAIDQAIAALPEKCRLIFCLHRFDRLTYAEIAQVQEISIKTVETQMGRALKFLRGRLADLL